MDSDIERGEISEGIQPIETCINASEESFKRRDMSLLFGDEEGGGEDIMLIDEDLYNIDVSVAITETETDEVNSEFSDAQSEIDGERSFPCSSCDKVCKSKSGLTRHANSKHAGMHGASAVKPVLCQDTVPSFVEYIKSKCKEEKLYGPDIIDALGTVSCTEALLDAVMPIYQTFCRKKNQDKFLESFYSLIPRSCELLSCNDYRVANVIMIHLPERLIGYCIKKRQ